MPMAPGRPDPHSGAVIRRQPSSSSGTCSKGQPESVSSHRRWPPFQRSPPGGPGQAPMGSGGHGEVDVADRCVEGVGDQAHQEGLGGDQVVGADRDAWGVGVVLVAPELGPVALEDGVVAPDGLVGPAGKVDVAYQVGVHGRSWTWCRVMGSRPAKAVFEWIEAWYNPRRRHTSLGDLAPAEFENLHTAAVTAA